MIQGLAMDIGELRAKAQEMDGVTTRPEFLLFAFGEQATKDEKQVRWALGKPSHEIRNPGFAKRNIDPEGMPLGDDFLLQVAPDPQQHLKFILAGRQAKPLDVRVSVINEGRGIRRYGHGAARSGWQKNRTR